MTTAALEKKLARLSAENDRLKAEESSAQAALPKVEAEEPLPAEAGPVEPPAFECQCGRSPQNCECEW